MDRLRLGKADLFRIEEQTIKFPLSMYSHDEDLIARHWHWMSPTYVDDDRLCDTVMQSWILQVDGRIILVDPCTGNGRHFPGFPPMHMLDTPYIERFAATGIRPEDVDFVFCTHMHMDHCGWNTELRDGRYVPTFPNARYIMVQREFDRWDTRRPDHQPLELNAGVFENSILPVLEAGLAQLVPDRFSITDHVHVEPAHGHTVGHSLLRMITEVREAWFVGDAFHHPIELINPAHDDGGTEDWPVAVATRHRIIDACLERQALFIPAHFPCPFGGTLRRDGEGVVRFDPLLIEDERPIFAERAPA
jgi:glyoxylase-like metal-dependent hydrolase (beta-lactamase superfamily II)